jgi:hypothetical protein
MLAKICSIRSIVRLTGCRPARLAHAAGQRDVQRLGLELRLELFVRQLLAAVIEGRFDRLLGQVDGRAACLFLVHAQRRHALHQLGDAAGLAGELRLRVLQLRGCRRLGEGLAGTGNDGFEFVHEKTREKWKGASAASPSPCPDCTDAIWKIAPSCFKQPAWP